MSRGRLAEGSESFRVEELPLYEPCGEGEHLYLEVEARDLTTDATAELVARACKVPRRAVSFAGRKDRRAVTRQWFSVHGTHEAEPQVEDDRAVILHGARHRNRLRRGHLRGNRFALRLELEAEAAAEVGSDLQQIAQLGLENEFGPQRFGRGGSTLRAAIELARGSAAAAVEILIDPKGRWSLGSPLPTGGGEGLTRRMRAALERHADDAEGALRAAGAELTRLLASAAQAEIFNRVLAARRAAGRLHVLRTGDVARRGLGRPFLARAEEIDELNRCAAPGVLEVAATGPLPGTNRFGPEPEILVEEQDWSRAAGVDWTWFEKGGPLVSPGDRRALIVAFVEAPALVERDGAHWLEFALPRGSFATQLLAALDLDGR